MKIDLSYRNMDMKFGVSDWVDVDMEYILQMDFQLDLGDSNHNQTLS